MRRISAVIVTYNNKHMLKELLQDLLSQRRPPDEIIVVDNASSDGTQQLVKENFARSKYFRLPENTGTAGGYYIGIKIAMDKSDFIWTLDDDIRVPPDALEELIKGFESLESSENIGIARSVGKDNSLVLPKKMDYFTWRGSLIRTELFRKFGLPNKEFFIYGEDFEYSLRLAKKGYTFFWIPRSKCIEKRRDDKIKYIFFAKVLRVYREAFRLYYAFRNSLYIYLRYHHFKEAIITLFYGLEVILCIIISEGLQGLPKIKAIQKGVVDGIRGKLGRINF